MVNLLQVEEELKKRWSPKYKWGIKQVDIWDIQTNFVFGFDHFKDVNDELHDRLGSHSRFEDIRDYALSRWYNFIAQRAITSIFISHPLVRQLKDDADFYIDGLSFELKIISFPTHYSLPFDEAKHNRESFLDWVFEQGVNTEIDNNTICLVLHSLSEENWKLKAELGIIKHLIYKYLDRFSRQNLIHKRTPSGMVYTEALFFEK